ncbi:hypothetical protein J0X15_07690 [Roseibium sp. CAU 1637]|uniref:Uncharacterized protein n=1 Tax=Roseibium limicola TaxID=2816037 RepID=A0A939J8A1_9HYPH|nr:DUF6030 family protein [Roseibium limicola]MBO0345096.1 hypothetical protein [Roseibium limicola]
MLLVRRVLLSVGLVVFLAGAVAALYVSGMVAHEENAAEVVTAPAAPPDPLAHISQTARARLLDRDLELPIHFIQSMLADPEAICALLDDVGLETNDWQKAPFYDTLWQCASETVSLSTASVDFGKATLFVLVRGRRQGEVRSIRLKLNVPDPNLWPFGLENLQVVLGRLESQYSLVPPDGFAEAVVGFQRYEAEQRGVKFAILPEDPELAGDDQASRRLNLLFQFPEVPTILPADGFHQRADPSKRTDRPLLSVTGQKTLSEPVR